MSSPPPAMELALPAAQQPAAPAVAADLPPALPASLPTTFAVPPMTGGQAFMPINMTGGTVVVAPRGGRPNDRGGRRGRHRRTAPSPAPSPAQAEEAAKKEALRQLRKMPVEKFTDIKSVELAINALQEAQRKAEAEISVRAAKIEALLARGRQLQLQEHQQQQQQQAMVVDTFIKEDMS